VRAEPREDAVRRLRVAVIGAGPGGLCAAIRLTQEGFDDLVVFEQAAGVGGTWWHNTYPGAACDVMAHLYSFSFAPKADWSRHYADQAEILGYFEDCARRFDVERRIRCNTAVRSVTWDDARSSWQLRTAEGDEHEADVVIGAQGMFNLPAWPEIPGLERFGGQVFHTARWDHSVDLAGREVAVIGSAASAVQCIPQIAKVASHLSVYQRTANWVLPKDDAPYDDEELARFRSDPASVAHRRQRLYDRYEEWIALDNPAILERLEAVGRAALLVVEDPELRAKLEPVGPFGCKRPLLSDDFYPTFNRPNVELVTEGISEITSSGIVTADGTTRPADVIVCATGFHADRYLSALEVVGRGGTTLREAWTPDAHAYLGMAMPGFPNLFMLYGPNTNAGSIIFMIECQVEYILRQLRRMDAEHLAWLEVRPEVVEAYNDALQHDIDQVVPWQAGVHGYYRGKSGRIVTQWPHTMTDYRDRTERPDDDAYDVGLLPGTGLAREVTADTMPA
jgi:cation diffusion facilitator CzcD-associated flavoprotein CzcO